MKKVLLVVSILLVLLLAFTGCAATAQNTSADGADYYSEAEVAEAPAAAPEEAAEDAAGASDESGTSIDFDSSILEPGVDRKIVYDGYIDSRTKKFDEDYDTILTNLKQVGGYVESSSISGTKPTDWQDQGRYASMALRVPSDKFDTFMNMLKGLGETVSTSISGTDISLQYFDKETRLATLRTRETRLLKLLEEAAGLEDIIEIERELANVSYEIQILETELRDYDSLVDYSRVTINLQEVNAVSEVTPSDESLGERISNGFFSVVNALSDFGEGLIVFLVAGSPVIIPLVVIAIVVIILVKRGKRKRAAKNNINPMV